ncbi:plasmalemma vesicle associated protein b [Chiloscyllium punctatum]|uniref:Plasmalemma vesicle-associated protein n=1 Tax=Chiloscyllium punctatum TaxID=137246 RepID=A0A401T114_CHIPU|nr:hypothetical protein [Chiloscyllium punctatum]
MDHNSYPMKKLGYDSKDYQRAKPNSCDYYVKYFLLCTSIIQLLIILGLVLFMVYGNNQRSQQSRLETSRNQSVKFIGDINELHTNLSSQSKELKTCHSTVSNLTIHLIRLTNSLRVCIKKNTTKPQPRGPLPYDNNLQTPFEKFRFCTMLQQNYSTAQMQIVTLKADNELHQAKHILEVTKLNSQKAELLRQLADQRGNCTSMNKDFKKMMDETSTVYEAGFREVVAKVGGRYDPNLSRQLEQMRANCTALTSNFRTQLQQRIDSFVATFKHIWQSNNEQSSRISNLEKMNEECQREAAVQLHQFKRKESQLQTEKESYLEEKVQLLQERNLLRSQLAAKSHQSNFFLNPGSSNTRSTSCQSEYESAISQFWLLQKEKIALEDHKIRLEQQLATLKQQLGDCYNLAELQKRLGCRMTG